MVKEKRERLATSSQVSIDRISILPNEVLGLILSLLAMKEAIRTSILSRSWRYSWLLTHNMLFKAKRPSSQKANDISSSTLDKARFNFVRWVDRVLYQCSHQRSDIEKFGVLFDLNESHTVWIDDWLSYALSRKVKTLELRLVRPNNSCNTCYKFPYKKENFPDNFKLLKELSLHLVSVTGEAVEFFLGNCPVLEQVSLSRSKALSSLEIIGTFPSFKCLEISMCPRLKSVKLRDSDVVTIKYCGKIIQFVLINVPLLTQLWTKLSDDDCLKDVYKMFSPVLPQLEMFKIYFTHPLSWQDSEDFIKSNLEMRNLKQLVVSIGKCYGDKDSLISIANIINASPCLQRFIIEAEHKHSKHDTRRIHRVAEPEEIRYKQNPRTYYHFKEIKFLGYRGVKKQLKLIEHFAKQCVALENIIVDPRCFNLYSHRPWDNIYRCQIKDEISARDYAQKQFKKLVLDPKTNVKIL